MVSGTEKRGDPKRQKTLAFCIRRVLMERESGAPLGLSDPCLCCHLGHSTGHGRWSEKNWKEWPGVLLRV